MIRLSPLFLFLTLFISPSAETKALRTSSFLVGVGLQYAQAQASLRDTYKNHRTNDLNNSGTHMSRKLQISPSFEAGIDLSNKYYLGVYTAFYYGKHKDKTEKTMRGNYTLSDKLSVRHYSEFSIKGGYKFRRNFLFFARVGPSLGYFEHTTTQFKRKAFVKDFKVRRKALGIIGALGFDCYVTRRLVMSVELTHAVFQSFKGNTSMSVTESNNLGQLTTFNFSGSKTIRPSISTFGVRLAWRL